MHQRVPPTFEGGTVASLCFPTPLPPLASAAEGSSSVRRRLVEHPVAERSESPIRERKATMAQDSECRTRVVVFSS